MILLQRTRKASVIIGTHRVEGLRITFAIEKKDKREANKAIVTITNLSAQTRALFDVKNLRVVVEAGYVESGVGGIFVGTSYKTTHKHEGVEFVTTIEAADGGKEINNAKGSWSFAPGARIADVVRTVALGLGLPISTGSVLTPSPLTFPKGWAFVGGAAEALDAVTRAGSLTWSVQDAQVQILPEEGGDGVQAVVLSKETGMIGSPERADTKDEKTGVTTKRVVVKCQINPLIRPRRAVVVRSVDQPGLSGAYVVKSQKIEGDNFGDAWTMTNELALR